MEEQNLNLYYLSNNNFDCVPVLVPIKLDYNQFPFVVDAPEGMNEPKYDWTHSRWIDQTNANQQNQIADLKQAFDAKSKEVNDLQIDIKEQNQALTQAIGNLTQLVTQAMMAKPTTDGGDK